MSAEQSPVSSDREELPPWVAPTELPGVLQVDTVWAEIQPARSSSRVSVTAAVAPAGGTEATQPTGRLVEAGQLDRVAGDPQRRSPGVAPADRGGLRVGAADLERAGTWPPTRSPVPTSCG